MDFATLGKTVLVADFEEVRCHEVRTSVDNVKRQVAADGRQALNVLSATLRPTLQSYSHQREALLTI